MRRPGKTARTPLAARGYCYASVNKLTTGLAPGRTLGRRPTSEVNSIASPI